MPQSTFTDAYAAMLDLLIEIRKERGITQSELAKKLGKPQPWVSNVERGVRRLDIIEFVAVGDALRVDRQELFRGVLEKLPEPLKI